MYVYVHVCMYVYVYTHKFRYIPQDSMVHDLNRRIAHVYIKTLPGLSPACIYRSLCVCVCVSIYKDSTRAKSCTYF